VPDLRAPFLSCVKERLSLSLSLSLSLFLSLRRCSILTPPRFDNNRIIAARAAITIPRVSDFAEEGATDSSVVL